MRDHLPGLGGSLLPGRYLADHMLADAGAFDAAARDRARWRLRRWWRDVARTCGPASGIRALFDVAAMPLAAALGFRADAPVFAAHHAHARLSPPTAPTSAVALHVAPWAHQPPTLWRDAVRSARIHDAPWVLIVAPPYVQLLDARAWARRSIDAQFPEVLDDRDAFTRFWLLTTAASFTPLADHASPRVHQLVAAGAAFQDAVRDDLRRGVGESLAVLDRVLRRGSADTTGPSRDALAVVYRVLFLLFAESRELVPWRHPLYGPAYSVSRMCEAARHDPRAAGYWSGLAAVSRLLRVGCRTPELDVPPFNGHLFSRASAPALERRQSRHHRRTRHEDRAVADTLVQLSSRATRTGRETIAYPDLGVEQLGAVYEHVLAEPHRKQSGSFYTPRALTEFIVRRTLAPLTRGASADAILALRVVDPAMGSGAFLVAACRFLARAYEQALLDERRLLPHEIDAARRADFRRLVAQHCLYGVDRNPVAVQLARLSLWLATLASGKPLTFLDHRLRTGDALIGARLDDLRHVSGARTRATMPLFDDTIAADATTIAGALTALAAEADDAIEAVRRKEAAWSRLNRTDSALARQRLAAHVWCARWFERAPASVAEVRAVLDAVLRGDATLPTAALTARLTSARAAADQHHFFHWPLEFADVFTPDRATGNTRAPGFDAVIGNPPWEMLRADHGEASAATTRFLRGSGLYDASGRGHVNLYQPFVERALDLTRPGGAIGLVLPWGIASDDGSAALRARLLDECRITTWIGFDNAEAIFPVHRGLRFAAVVARTADRTDVLPMINGITRASALDALCDADDVLVGALPVPRAVVTPPGDKSRRIPDVRRAADLERLDTLTRRWPALGDPRGWAAQFGRELNASDDRDLFGDDGLPVLDGKDIAPFVAQIDPPRRRITRARAEAALPARGFTAPRLAYRDVSAVSNRQSLIAALIPAGVVTTHTLFCVRTPLPLAQQHFLCACFNSYVLNALVRVLMGGHLTTSLVERLPVPPWTGSTRQRRIARLAARLARAHAATARTSSSAASASMSSGTSLPARLQALVAAEYGLTVTQFADVLGGFPLIADADRRAAGDFLEHILMET